MSIDRSALGRLDFDVVFHTPFRVATGRAERGLDATVSTRDPLPASSVKGVMRRSLLDLGCPPSSVDEVFGSARRPSRWSWLVGSLSGQSEPVVHTRVTIDPTTRTAVPDRLQFAEALDAERATVAVRLRDTTDVDDDSLVRHAVLIAGAACGVHALGGSRRRGFGWVGIAPSPGTAAALDDAAVAAGQADWIDLLGRELASEPGSQGGAA